MKINNKPNKTAVKKFTLSWKSLDDNDNIRSKEFVKVSSIDGYGSEFVGEMTIKNIGEENVRVHIDFPNPYNNMILFYDETSQIIIFVKEFNAYYKAEYTAVWDENLEDRNVYDDKLDFKILPTGAYNVKKYDFQKFALSALARYNKTGSY